MQRSPSLTETGPGSPSNTGAELLQGAVSAGDIRLGANKRPSSTTPEPPCKQCNLTRRLLEEET